MKVFYFNIQEKGGAGKSMLTYLQALKNEAIKSAAFVDLDSSSKTSSLQLKFLKSSERLFAANIFDNLKKIEREKLFEIIEGFCSTDFERFYIDFGAPESQQLPDLFSIDFSADEFLVFQKELGVKFVFNVIMAGGSSYIPSFEYLKRIIEPLKGKFDVIVYINEFTFQNYPALIDEIKAFTKETKGLIKDIRQFGNIYTDRRSGQLITDNIKEGKGLAAYTSFAAKTIIRREIAKVE